MILRLFTNKFHLILLGSSILDAIYIFLDIICTRSDAEWSDGNFILLGAFNVLTIAQTLNKVELVDESIEVIENYVAAMKRYITTVSDISCHLV